MKYRIVKYLDFDKMVPIFVIERLAAVRNWRYWKHFDLKYDACAYLRALKESAINPPLVGGE